MAWNDEFPVWQDDGKKISVRTPTVELTGTLYYEDFDSDEEGNEWPLWRIKLQSGETHSLFEFDEWMLT